MNLERRDSAAPSPEETSPASDGGKKPVIIYILILFLVAFLLMTLSLLSHQRSNTEAIGALSDSVAAMKDAQSAQERVLELQEQLSQAQEEIKQLEKEIEQTQEARERSEEECTALAHLAFLAELYFNGDFEGCQRAIDDIEVQGYDQLYSISTKPDITSPNSLYERIKADVEAQTAEPTEAEE